MIHNKRILLFIPTFNCGANISRVLAEITDIEAKIIDHVLILDNGSTDTTIKAATVSLTELFSNHKIPVVLLQNRENINLGGSHKVAFDFALEHRFDAITVMHGDYQGRIKDLIRALRDPRHMEIDYYLGSRFLQESKCFGYSLLRITVNKMFNFLFGFIAARKIYDLGSGLNIFNCKALKDRHYHRFPNTMGFNYHMLCHALENDLEIAFFPHEWHETDSPSNAKLSKIGLELALLWLKFTMGLTLFKKEKMVIPTYRVTCIYDSKIEPKPPNL